MAEKSAQTSNPPRHGYRAAGVLRTPRGQAVAVLCAPADEALETVSDTPASMAATMNEDKTDIVSEQPDVEENQKQRLETGPRRPRRQWQ